MKLIYQHDKQIMLIGDSQAKPHGGECFGECMHQANTIEHEIKLRLLKMQSTGWTPSRSAPTVTIFDHLKILDTAGDHLLISTTRIKSRAEEEECDRLDGKQVHLLLMSSAGSSAGSELFFGRTSTSHYFRWFENSDPTTNILCFGWFKSSTNHTNNYFCLVRHLYLYISTYVYYIHSVTGSSEVVVGCY